jgi:hypothetical protein
MDIPRICNACVEERHYACGAKWCVCPHPRKALPLCRKCGKELHAATDHYCHECGTRRIRNFVKWTVCSIGVLIAIICTAAIFDSSVRVTALPPMPGHTSKPEGQMRPATFDEMAAVIKGCGKPASNRPKELNAGAGSEGRALIYSKFKTELWFYRGLDSTQWMLFSAFPQKGDDVLEVNVLHTRMPCTKNISYHNDFIDAAASATDKSANTPVPKGSEQKQVEAAAEAEKKKKAVEELHWQLAIVAARSLREAMRNPDSFKLVSAYFTDHGAVCYRYRAQNGFGGLNIGQAVLSATGEFKTDETNGFSSLWNKECAHKSGTDKTFEVDFAM